jgi:hypothetical protein
MFILNILNYPIIDSNYYWHIKSISKDEIKYGDETAFSTFRGVNNSFSPSYDFSRFANLNFIIDIDNKAIKCIDKNNQKETEEINMLLKYFEKILNGKKVKSVFIYNSLIALKEKLNVIKKEYEKKVKNDGTFFNVSKVIIDINKQIQEIFYDFVLEILIVLYKDYKLKNDCTDIIKDIHRPVAVCCSFFPGLGPDRQYCSGR